jgi:hypothetical protein
LSGVVAPPVTGDVDDDNRAMLRVTIPRHLPITETQAEHRGEK